MFQQEAMRDAWSHQALGYAGDARGEEASLSDGVGHKPIRDASGEAPTAVQRLALAQCFQIGERPGKGEVESVTMTMSNIRRPSSGAKEVSSPRLAFCA
jgi:hypothetical protein